MLEFCAEVVFSLDAHILILCQSWPSTVNQNVSNIAGHTWSAWEGRKHCQMHDRVVQIKQIDPIACIPYRLVCRGF